jgi:hypothetical protein
MNNQQQITPTLSLGKLALIGLVTVATVWFVVHSRVSRGNYSGNEVRELLPAGCIYGLLAAGCWLATVVDHRYGRLVIRALMVVGATTLLGAVREYREWLQTAADFSGLAIIQCALFFWFQVPKWQSSWSANSNQRESRNDQFAIADIVIATTVIALLFSLAIRYSPAIRPAAYWLVLAAAWSGGGVVTTCIAKGMTSKKILRTIVLISIGAALAFVGTYAIAVADSIADEGRVSEASVRIFASFYGRIVWGYLLTFACFASLARISPS